MEKSMARHTILLVDDEEHILSSLERALRTEPYAVLRGMSGPDALDILESGLISLIISDLNMPGMNGLELLQIVKEQYPEVIRVVLTGQADTGTALRAINEGEVYRFFTKPWNNDELRLSIRETLCHFDLVHESKRLLARLAKQEGLLREIESRYPGITKGATDEVFEVSEELLSISAEDYLRELCSMKDSRG
jgi:DNA-binding NtrC family response regulator